MSFTFRQSGLALAFAVAALGLVGRAQAASITVTYLGNVIEGAPGVDAGLPYFLSAAPNNLRLKFFVPDFESLGSIDSISVEVNVYDDDDPANDRGDILFVLNGIGDDNILLNSFLNLNGSTAGAPVPIPGLIDCGCELDAALLEIQDDGIFFIRVNRRAGGIAPGSDFWVQGGTVEIDGELVPEPASLALVATGLAGLVVERRRRGRR